MLPKVPLVVTLSLLAAVNYQSADAVQSSKVTLEGGIGFVQACGDSVESTRFLLTDRYGKSAELDFPGEIVASYGGAYEIARHWARVEGRREPNGHISVMRFSPMPKRLMPPEVEEAGPLTTSGFAPAASKPYVTILVRFKDTAAIVPHTKSYYENLLITGDPGINPYFQESSYGAMNLNGSAVIDWITLPKNSTDYKVTGGIGVDDEAVIKDAIAAADPQVDFSKFDGFNIVLNTALGVIGGTGGREWLTLDGVTKAWGRTYCNSFSSMFGLFAHEMGHTFGFDHSSGPYDTPYDSDYDQMSRGGSNHFDPKVGYLSQQTNAYHRAAVGWIPDKRNLLVLPGSDTTVRIERLTKPTAAGFLIARIPLGGSVSHYLTVECRRWIGNYDAKQALPHEGIVLHDVDTQRWVPDPFNPGRFGADRHSEVVDVDNNRDPNDDASIWVPGETYTDSKNKVSVSVISSGPTFCTVRIVSSAQVPAFNVVKNTADTGASSLRNALLYSQMFPKTVIKFELSNSDPGYANGVYTIQPISTLPPLTQAQTVIDATTQTTILNTNPLGPEVYLDGSKASEWDSALSVSGTEAKILGLGAGGWQIGVNVAGASQTFINQCYLGTDPTGVKAIANRFAGIHMENGTKGSVVSNCLLSGNSTAGILIRGKDTTGVSIRTCSIGTSANGLLAIPNGAPGIYILEGAHGINVGGAARGQGNLISGNGHEGVWVQDAGGSATILGNWIGLDSTGKKALPNVYTGVACARDGALIVVGGTVGSSRNYIAGNGADGIGIYSGSGSKVVNNFVGTDITGRAAIGNGATGIWVGNAARATIGGPDAVSGNLVCSSKYAGIGSANATDLLIQGNVVGLDLDRKKPMPNGGGLSLSTAVRPKVLGNLVSGNLYNGIGIWADSTRGTVSGNTCGLSGDGKTAVPNQYDGISVGHSDHIAITNNVASGNGNVGVGLYDSAASVTLTGNIIGYDGTGKYAYLQNGGVQVLGGSHDITIGGIGATDRNLISNIKYNGIYIGNPGTTHNTVIGNLIGLDPTGNGPCSLGVGYQGVVLHDGTTANTIGGNTAAEMNYFGGCHTAIIILGKDTANNLVQGNQVGTGIDGKTAASNDWSGIGIAQSAHDNIVRNNWVTNYNGCGITLTDTGTTKNKVLGNIVGTNIGLATLNTGWGGIGLWNGASGNQIGGISSTDGNFIARTGTGIYLNDLSTGNTIRGNRSLLNKYLAIDLGGNGVTQNDSGDADSGPNNYQNFPSITSVSTSVGQTTVFATLSSRPSARYVIDAYLCDSPNNSGVGDASVWAGSINVLTDRSGTVTIKLPLTAAGKYVCLTATDLSTGDTSELSPCAQTN